MMPLNLSQSNERVSRLGALNREFVAPFKCPYPRRPTDSRPAPWVGGVLFTAILGMLNMPLVFTVITGMDQYGIFTIDHLARRPLPLILSAALNIVMALAGSATYLRLWKRQDRFTADGWGPFKRALALIAPPALVAFAPFIVFTSDGGKPTAVVVVFLIIISLSMTTALGDRQMRLDPSLARTWMSLAFATIVVLLVLSMSAMWVIHEGEQTPARRNLFWNWNYEWRDLGYPPEEFGLRQNDALRIFVPGGSAFMIGVLGTVMLGAMWRWARLTTDAPTPQDETRSGKDLKGLGRPSVQPSNLRFGTAPDAPDYVKRICDRMEYKLKADDEEPSFRVRIGDHTFRITGSQYEKLITDKDSILAGVDLLIDKEAGNVFTHLAEGWSNTGMRMGTPLNLNGPFALLSLVSEHPGKRFQNSELRSILTTRLGSSPPHSVRSFIRQLEEREGEVFVRRDRLGVYLPESVRVCIVERT